MNIRNEKGFTLVEIMVVVALIGILAAVAVPRISGFQDKAKKSEAKMLLSQVYQAEKVFHTEYDSYVSAIPALGITADSKGKYYAFGWKEAAGSVDDAFGSYKLKAADIAAAGGYYLNNKTDSAVKASGTAKCLLSSVLPVKLSTTTSTTAFTASAAAPLGSACNKWTIDQTKNLTEG